MASCFPGFCFANGHMLRDRNVWLKGWLQLCDVVVTQFFLVCVFIAGTNEAWISGTLLTRNCSRWLWAPGMLIDSSVTDLIVGIAGCLLSCRVPGTNCGRGSAWNNALIVGSAVLLFGCPHGRCKSNYIWSTWCGIDSRETSSFMQLIPPNRSFFANYVVANRDVVSDWFSLALLRPKGLTGMQHPSQNQGTACGAKWDVANNTFFQPITNDIYTCQWSSAQCLFEYCCNCFAGPRFKVRPWSRNDQGFPAYDVDEF